MPDHFRVIPLFADAGVPMIFLTFPAMVILLVPVIVVEGFLCQRWLHLGTWQAMKSSAVSNLASTIVGVPVAWATMLGVEFGGFGLLESSQKIQNWHSPIANVIFFLLSSAWLGPPSEKDVWVIPAATLVLLIPFFFASYWIEYFIMRTMIGVHDADSTNLAYPRVRVAVRNANLVTYGTMFIATSVWLGVLVLRGSW